MNAAERAAFEQADQKEHPVETQWHFPILTKYGYVAKTPTATGFVRTYVYEKDGHEIACVTGNRSDYWKDTANNEGGYWSSLEPHLKKLVGTN